MPPARLLAALAALAASPLPLAAQSPAADYEVRVVARGLHTPWSLTFAPDGRLLVAERPGRIRVIQRDSLAAEPWATIPVFTGEEAGLMGLAVDPRFAENGRLYACYTALAADNRAVNRIGVLTERGGRGSGPEVLLDGIPAGEFHNGCRLSFGPDGKLYATMGDVYQRETAQSLESLAGKILRLNPDGSVPPDNPFPGSYVWSYGHRNPQGLAWEPASGRLLATEHGTGPGGGNELNVIERGGNYGWPTVIGRAGDARFIDPILVGGDAPAGATFVTSERYPELRGSLLLTGLSAERALRVTFRDGSVERTDGMFEGTLGRLRDVVQGPDGYLYLATSNRDGRGRPGPEDDRILRLLPRRGGPPAE